MTDASFHIASQAERCTLNLCGDWHLGKAPDATALCDAIPHECKTVMLSTETLGTWDSSLAIVLL